MESNKLKMVLAGIAGTLLVLLIKGLFPDLPDGVIEWAIGVVGGVPSLGAIGQSVADGMSKGLTSSKSKQIISSGVLGNLPASVPGTSPLQAE